MVKFYNKLPKRFQKALDDAVAELDGGKNPEITAAWREYEAEIILESEVDDLSFKTTTETAVSDYEMYRAGWQAGAAEREALHRALNNK